jgi:predicted PurR-regulated permease PerM
MTATTGGRDDTGERAAERDHGPDRSTAPGHHPRVALPHTEAEGPIAEAERAAAHAADDDHPLGEPGRPLDRRSPFMIGLIGSAGVAVTAGLVLILVNSWSALLLIGVALFLAIGLEPAVSGLVRRGVRRPLAVTGVSILLVVVVAAFLAAAIVPLAAQAAALFDRAPAILQDLQNRNSVLGGLGARLQIQQRIEQLVGGNGSTLVNGVLGAGAAVFGVLADSVVVLVLTVYFLASLPSTRVLVYRLVPHSRRPRVILIGDEVLAKVGAYVLGNVLISAIIGVVTFIWLEIFQVPYPLALSVLVALLDLVPVVGSTIAGIIVALVALSVSWPVALATVAFYIVYRFLEDYLLVPKIMGRAVDVPDTVTVVSVLIGGVLLGVVGALVAIPVAAAVTMVLREAVFPRLDRA